jgi:hypothetical protein
MNLAQSLEIEEGSLSHLVQPLGAEEDGIQFHFHAFVHLKNGFGLLSVWM